jgi:glutamyl-Q tRNA(Asp) synthetase
LPDDPGRRASEPHCWRLNSSKALETAGLPNWTEDDGRVFTASERDVGDAILARKDAPASYHLSCVVDDAASGVTMVVRGADLRASTPIQRLLQQLLGLPEPRYFHHALVTHEDGRRLAKRDLAPTLAAMREIGIDGPALVADLLADKLPLGFAFRDE